jgi:hypothetical protein
MRVILVNKRYGHTQTYVIKGWLKGLLSLCLLGAPVALGYLGYQLSVQSGDQIYAQQQHASSHTSPALAGTATPVEEASAALAGADSEHSASAPAETDETIKSDLPRQFVLVPPATPEQLSQTVGSTLRTFRHGRIIDPVAYLAHIGH